MDFIDYNEKEEILWNTKLQVYRNRDDAGVAVNRIVLAMNIFMNCRPTCLANKSDKIVYASTTNDSILPI